MTSPSRDSSFPVTSLSRSGSLRISKDTSRESLITHPLLSPSSSSASATPATTNVESPRYVPYTPRQRASSSIAPTATTSQQPPPVATAQLGGTTNKLQSQNMRAVAQSLGLSNDSVGWAILQKLIDSENGAEWDDIWHTLEGGKATLLLPVETIALSDVVGPEFVKDHVAFCSTLPNRVGTAVTLSGLRISWEEDTMTFRSTVPTQSKRFRTITNAETSITGLLALPAIPTTSAYRYPTNTILSYEPVLPVTQFSGHDGKPLLPPRLGARSAVAATGSVSRLSNPFASLFARPGTPTNSPTVNGGPHLTLEVPALMINTKIIRKELHKEISIGVTLEIKDSFSDLPSPMVNKILTFVAPLYPSPKTSKSSAARSDEGHLHVSPGSNNSPEVLSESFQSFYYSLEEDLEAQRVDNDDGSSRPAFNAHESRLIMERIERTVLTLFYDQLFRPSESDDIMHDEVLASRIAALNMLDLSLDHLGIDTNEQVAEVDVVVRDCGTVLQKLGQAACKCPADKAALIVAAHHVIVEGLSRLSPIHLSPEGESRKDPIAVKHPVHEIVEPILEGGVSNQDVAPVTDTLDVVQSPVSLRAAPDEAVPNEDHSRPPPPLPPRPHTPPTRSKSTPTPVSSDTLLPLIIFAVVKSNPSQLVSHLLFTQRFRARSVHGEESFCLVNLMAVVEFLENVDMSALGLGDSQRVMSVSDLTPIPLQQASASQSPSASARLRGVVGHQVGEVADAANKVILGVSGVVDTSFGVLRGLLPFQAPGQQAVTDKNSGLSEVQAAAPWNVERAGFGMLRRASGFSIASLPGFQKPRIPIATEENGQQMIEVPSRASSVHGVHDTSDADGSDAASGSSSGDESDDDDDDGDGSTAALATDARSVRSFSSMLSGGGAADTRDTAREKRMSLSDRLAQASKGSSSPSALGKSVPLPAIHLFDVDGSSRDETPGPSLRIAPPNARFLSATETDLRVSEVGDLLREYKRVVEGMRVLGGFRDV